ncbi:MAG: methyltransferase domain-containing protein [Thermogemmatispora sp.]|uniref:class I SAM-dependent methyltransferase n=1 Tax=Thermogemmatispora sp. TaxID=1968838 RepID=UPI002623DFD2|nr:class I SAM-dependent methyltransferase [Thermogemmatispora sp.]MBX5458204.1 methyltransferase domain-containing protein [Thermogemmatispora sp.]
MEKRFVPNQKRLRRFQDHELVSHYHLRPFYPPETFVILEELMVDEPRVVLDLGCGTGNVARPLAASAAVERIDAVDVSLAMLERARELPGGDAPTIRWIHGRAEDVALTPPYALVTAGMCLHWMDWGQVLPRLAHMLTPRGLLAILNLQQSMPWLQAYQQIRRRFADERPAPGLKLVAAMEQRGLFRLLGERQTAPLPMQQTVEDYIAAQYAYSSLAGLDSEQRADFEQEMRTLLTPFARDGLLSFEVVATITWGRPCDAAG